MAESKISPHSLSELKNTTDDAIGNYLRGLQFAQDNSKLDVRLAIGYSSVVIAAAIFAADYKLGWEATKGWTVVAVAAYAVLSAALQYWLWFVEKGIVFEGVRDGKKLSIASKTQKHDPTYYLAVSVSTTTGSAPSTWQIKAPFTTWFTADGYFVPQPFQKWLATSIQAIGDADPKNSGAEEAELNSNATATGIDRASKATRSNIRLRHDLRVDLQNSTSIFESTYKTPPASCSPLPIRPEISLPPPIKHSMTDRTSETTRFSVSRRELFKTIKAWSVRTALTILPALPPPTNGTGQNCIVHCHAVTGETILTGIAMQPYSPGHAAPRYTQYAPCINGECRICRNVKAYGEYNCVWSE